MLIQLIIFSTIIIVYGFFITTAIFGINKLNNLKIFKMPSSLDCYISIVISIKNEAHNALSFIQEIEKQTYLKSQFELILIDDDSNDNSYQVFDDLLQKTNITYQIIKQHTHKGKKQNISQAIELAKGEIIITTDADVCYRSLNWLQNIAIYFNGHQPNALIMPLDFEEENSVLSAFQITENIALTAITAGFCGVNKAILCNGANFAFLKKAFVQVGGYQSHSHISSGEDIFLLESLMSLDATKIHYSLNKQLIVKTKTITSGIEFINQRLRWAYKSKYSTNKLNAFFGFIVIGTNLVFLALAVSYLKKSAIMPYLSIFACTKLIFDFLLLFLASKFLDKEKYLWFFIPFQCVYWLYALVIGMGALFIKPKWKGIKVK